MDPNKGDKGERCQTDKARNWNKRNKGGRYKRDKVGGYERDRAAWYKWDKVGQYNRGGNDEKRDGL